MPILSPAGGPNPMPMPSDDGPPANATAIKNIVSLQLIATNAHLWTALMVPLALLQLAQSVPAVSHVSDSVWTN